MKGLGFSKYSAGLGASGYHKYAYWKDVFKGRDRYIRVGPINEQNHLRAILKGHSMYTK